MSRASAAGADSAAIAAELVATLRLRSQTVATAESLTGGLVGYWITTVPGSSQVYRGGLIPYATDLKHRLALVSETTLAQDGPVAAKTAAEMASGAAEACGAQWGVATTGVAGPDQQDGHPVGQVYVAVARVGAGDTRAGGPGAGRLVEVRELRLTGDRTAIRSRAAAAALALLLEVLARADDRR